MTTDGTSNAIIFMDPLDFAAAQTDEWIIEFLDLLLFEALTEMGDEK